MIKIKVALISDIHGNILALKEAIKDAESQNVDKYVFLGDLITEFPFNNEVLDIIRQKSKYVLKGNKEEYMIQYDKDKYDWDNIQFKNTVYFYNNLTKDNLEFVKNLPSTISVDFEGCKLLFCHGSPKSVEELLNENKEELLDKYTSEMKEDVLVFGHTHVRAWHKVINNKLVLNAGCLGVCHYFIGKGEYTIIDIEDGKIANIESRIIEYDINLLKSMIEKDKILDEDTVLMNICFWSISGYYDKRHEFFEKASKKMFDTVGKRHRDDAQGIFTYFKMYSDEAWVGTMEEFKNYEMIKKVEG